MNDDIIKKIQDMVEQRRQAQEAAADKAEFEMNNQSNASYTHHAEKPYNENGFLLNDPEQVDNTPQYRYRKLRLLLDK